MDERLRFDTSIDPIATYHIPLVYELIRNSISLSRLKRALSSIIDKHKVLRTRLSFDENLGELQQEILDCVSPHMIVTQMKSDDDLHKILYDEETNVNIFNLNEGKVFRCHVVRRSTSIDEDVVAVSDILVFNFHHIAFDGASIDIFFEDLERAYCSDGVLEKCGFDYIDYSIHEREISLEESKIFWKEHLDGFLNTFLPLPYDRSPAENKTRSGYGITVKSKLSSDVVGHILTFMKEHCVTLHQIGLTAFYTFLFKLTQQTDLTVLTVTANRHRAELENMIGIFVNTLPQRIIIQPHRNFLSLVKDVKDVVLSTLSHAHVPFQDIGSNTTNMAHL